MNSIKTWHMFLLRCPKCKHDMKYQTDTLILTKKKKRCVYCGKTYGVRDNMIKKLN